MASEKEVDNDLPSTAIDDVSMDVPTIQYETMASDDVQAGHLSGSQDFIERCHIQTVDIGIQTHPIVTPRLSRLEKHNRTTQTEQTVPITPMDKHDNATQTDQAVSFNPRDSPTDRPPANAAQTQDVGIEQGEFQLTLKKETWLFLACLTVLFAVGLELNHLNTIRNMREEIMSSTTRLTSLPAHSEDSCFTGAHVDQVTARRGDLSFHVPCDPDHGGWLVFLRRYDGSVDFDLGWQKYKDGFGSQDGEFWLGLEKIHLLTSQRPYQLRVDMEDFEGNKKYTVYGSFQVGPGSDKYRLSLRHHNNWSTAGDSMLGYGGRSPWADLHDMAFTTKGNDNDNLEEANCALNKDGGWWYNKCSISNPTRQYAAPLGILWWTFKSNYDRIKCIQFKIRPA